VLVRFHGFWPLLTEQNHESGAVQQRAPPDALTSRCSARVPSLTSFARRGLAREFGRQEQGSCGLSRRNRCLRTCQRDGTEERPEERWCVDPRRGGVSSRVLP
jgi:hypothetical protein